MDARIAPQGHTAEPLLARLGEWVANADISPSAEARNTIHSALIDILGCFILGARQEAAGQTRSALLHDTGGPSAVYGTGLFTDPARAAFLNAFAGHLLEFDDWEIPGNTHPSVVLLPALLAAAPPPLAPCRLFECYAAGFEVIARLGEAMNFEHYDAGWHSTSTLGAIGAAAAVARFWRLDGAQTGHAMSIAVSRASGFTVQFGSTAKFVQSGSAAETGIVAAQLARAGITGNPDIIEAGKGYNALAGHGETWRFDAPFERLGQPLAIERYGLIFKLYPSCGYTHRIINCALAHHANPDIAPDAITAIDLHIPDFHYAILPFQLPAHRTEAFYSLPFCAALALVHGSAALDDFTPVSICRSAVAMLDRQNHGTSVQTAPSGAQLRSGPARPHGFDTPRRPQLRNVRGLPARRTAKPGRQIRPHRQVCCQRRRHTEN